MIVSRLVLLVLANIALNLGAVWLLYRWRRGRREACLAALRHQSGLLAQQVREIKDDMERKREVVR